MVTMEKDFATLNELGAIAADKIKLSFVKNIEEIPYVSTNDIEACFVKLLGGGLVTVNVDKALQVMTITRTDNNALMVVDFKYDTISFSDLNAFCSAPVVKETSLDLVALATYFEEDESKVIRRERNHTQYIAGKSVTIDTKNITLI